MAEPFQRHRFRRSEFDTDLSEFRWKFVAEYEVSGYEGEEALKGEGATKAKALMMIASGLPTGLPCLATVIAVFQYFKTW